MVFRTRKRVLCGKGGICVRVPRILQTTEGYAASRGMIGSPERGGAEPTLRHLQKDQGAQAPWEMGVENGGGSVVPWSRCVRTWGGVCRKREHTAGEGGVWRTFLRAP